MPQHAGEAARGLWVSGVGPLERLRRTARAILPAPVVRVGRRLQRTLYGYGWTLPPRLQPLPPTASQELTLAHRAWQIATCAEANQLNLCYYSMEIDGFALPGERAWEHRWTLLRTLVEWRDARVLELGCNLGLLSASAMREGAAAALGVDSDPALLTANRVLQCALGVTCGTARIDFDDDTAWETELAAFRPTIVTALSVLHWVRDQDRLMRFLARFDTVLYEGHGSERVERARLQRAGFTDIVLAGRSERRRAVFVARGPCHAAQWVSASRCGDGVDAD
jgi:hypothetical protein